MKMNVKKLLALVLALAMMLALCSPAFALSKGDVLECTGDDVNVRKGAGTSYGKLGQLDKGDKVTYLGKSGKWYKVEYNGKTAYVTSQYLKLSAAAGSSTDAANGTTLYATTGVRVRKGASTKTAQVGALAKDQAVEKLGKSGDWIQINYKGTKAYVHSKYLTSTVPESVKAEQELAASLNAVLLTQSTYVFRGPGKDYGFLYLADVGAKMMTTGIVDGLFTQVMTPQGVGYVLTAATIKVAGGMDSSTAVGSYERYVVGTNTMVYDRMPGTAGIKSIGNVSFGDKVTCYGEEAGYTKIAFKNTYGYVHSATLSATLTFGATDAANNTVVPSNPAHGTARVSSNTYVYGAAGFGVKDTLKAGANVITTGTSGSYTMILYGDKMDKTGYVETSKLNILSTGSNIAAGTQGYVTVKKGALLENTITGRWENAMSDTLVLLVSQDYTGYSIIRDANGVQYRVSSSSIEK